jgi:predicted benzoate:H+ symporter BenE
MRRKVEPAFSLALVVAAAVSAAIVFNKGAHQDDTRDYEMN